MPLASEAKTLISHQKFTDEQIKRGLEEVAWRSGNCNGAAKAMTEAGMSVNHTTVRAWKKQHAELYAEIRAKVMPHVKAVTAEAHARLADEQMDLSLAALNKLRSDLDGMEPKEVAAVMRNADIGSGIHTDKARDLRGEATVVIEHRNPTEILRALEAMGVAQRDDSDVIESVATEVPNAAASEPVIPH